MASRPGNGQKAVSHWLWAKLAPRIGLAFRHQHISKRFAQTFQSVQDSVNQVGQEMTKRNLNIQPTLTEHPGLPVRVIVNRDLVLRPYQPLFLQRGSSQ